MSRDLCKSRTRDEVVIENASKSLGYCSQANNAMSVMSPPAKSVPFLMFPMPSTVPNHGGTRPSRVQRREEGVWVGDIEHNT